MIGRGKPAEQPLDLAGLPEAAAVETLPAAAEAPLKTSRVAEFLGRAACGFLIAGAVLAPPVAAAVAAVQSPTAMELAPGWTVEASARFASTTTITAGPPNRPIVEVSLPDAHRRVPLLGDVSATVNLTSMGKDTAALSGTELSSAANIFDNFKNNAVKPIEASIINRAGGSAVHVFEAEAAAAGAGLGALLLGRRRRKRRLAGALPEDQAGSYKETPPAAATSASPEKLRRRRVVATVATLAITGSLAYAHGQLQAERPTNPIGSTVSLGSVLSRLSPTFDGATISGAGTQLLEQLKSGSLTAPPIPVAGGKVGIKASTEAGISSGVNSMSDVISSVLGYKESVDDSYRQIDANLQQAVAQFEQSGGLDYLQNPDNVPVLAVSDLHCNIPFEQNVLPKLTDYFGAQLIINTGDTDVSTGILPFENQCETTLANVLKPTAAHPRGIKMVDVPGNHDGPGTNRRLSRFSFKTADGSTVHPITVLGDKNGSAVTIYGMTFVGNPDPRQSIIGKQTGVQEAAVVAQGRRLVTEACRVKSQVGHSPIVLTHSPDATQLSLLMGCASFAFSGHTHSEALPHPVNNPSGALEYTFTQGTSSGASPNALTVYAAPGQPATSTIFIFSKSEKRFTGYINTVIAPDGSVEPLAFVPLPGSTLAAQP